MAIARDAIVATTALQLAIESARVRFTRGHYFRVCCINVLSSEGAALAVPQGCEKDGV